MNSLNNLPIDSSFQWMENYDYSEDSTIQQVAHKIGLQTLKKAYLSKIDSIIAKAHFLLREWHDSTKSFEHDSIVFHSKKAIEHYQKAGDQLKVAQCNTKLAYDYLSISELKNGQDALFNSLKVYEVLQDEGGMARAYQTLSLFSNEMGEPEKSIKYANEAIKLFEKNNEWLAVAMTYLRYIKSYTLLKQYDNGYEAASKCIELIATKVDPNATERGFSGRDVAGRAFSARGNVSILRENYQEALSDFTETWMMSVEDYGEEVSAGWRAEIGTAHRLLGNYPEALENLLAATTLIEKIGGSSDYLATLYTEISKSYELQKNYKKALEYKKKTRDLKDRMYEEKISALKTEAVVKYETGKKDQQLAAQEQQLSQKSKIQKLTSAIAVLLTALLFALFYSYRKNKKNSALLEKKNQENELLLKEIHHRVKNNLQTISSLLSLQSESITDQNAFDAVQESRNRVNSMASLHQKLYQGENLAAIEMRDYFETIGTTIIDSFGEKAKNITLEVDMSSIEMDIDTAIPVGLITNELVTNSLKHAFSEKQAGKIIIALKRHEDGVLRLNISDNGQNTSDELVSNKQKGFGTMLVQLLTTQLDGKINKSTEGGTTTVIDFPWEKISAA